MSTIERLAELAKGATQGEWKVEVKMGDRHLTDVDGTSMMSDTAFYPWVPDNDADWQHIAACNPAAITQAYSEYAELERRNAELVEAVVLTLKVAEGWIHDHLDGTESLEHALAELGPVRAAIAHSAKEKSDEAE